MTERKVISIRYYTAGMIIGDVELIGIVKPGRRKRDNVWEARYLCCDTTAKLTGIAIDTRARKGITQCKACAQRHQREKIRSSIPASVGVKDLNGYVWPYIGNS